MMDAAVKESLMTILEGLHYLRSRQGGLYTGIDVLATFTPLSSLEERKTQTSDPLSEEEFKEVLQSMRQFTEQIINTTAEISTAVDILYQLLDDSR